MIRHKATDKRDPLTLWREKWRENNPGGKERKLLPANYDEVKYDCQRDHDSFYVMVRACLRDGRFDIEDYINSTFVAVMKQPFPEEGGTLDELCEMIRRKLLKRAARRNSLDDIPDVPDWFEQDDLFQESKTIHISKTEASDMAKKEKDEEKKKTSRKSKDAEEMSRRKRRDEEDEDEKEEKSSRKKSRKRDEDDDEEDTGKKKKKKSKDKSAQSRLRCVELLMERKHTDEEIVDIIQEELDYPYSVKRVERIREGINEGKRERQGIPAPKPPLEAIEKGSKKKSKSKAKDEDEEEEKKSSKKSRKRKDEDDE